MCLVITDCGLRVFVCCRNSAGINTPRMKRSYGWGAGVEQKILFLLITIHYIFRFSRVMSINILTRLTRVIK